MSLSRAGCCETGPKPCPYHEGVADALDAVGAHMRLCVCGHLEGDHVPMRTNEGYFARCTDYIWHLSGGADPCPCPDFEAES